MQRRNFIQSSVAGVLSLATLDGEQLFSQKISTKEYEKTDRLLINAYQNWVIKKSKDSDVACVFINENDQLIVLHEWSKSGKPNFDVFQQTEGNSFISEKSSHSSQEFIDHIHNYTVKIETFSKAQPRTECQKIDDNHYWRLETYKPGVELTTFKEPFPFIKIKCDDGDPISMGVFSSSEIIFQPYPDTFRLKVAKGNLRAQTVIHKPLYRPPNKK